MEWGNTVVCCSDRAGSVDWEWMKEWLCVFVL